ncbi:MAG: hypothetical protein IPJ34_40885 [Myxococcales bacterium]|nr:hypothetical protein [Myxococcales bacterium]
MKHDWQDARDHKDVLTSVLRSIVADASVLVSTDARQMAHYRELRLSWPDGKVVHISLDQGLGFLEPTSFYAHRFERAAAEQARAILGASFILRATSSFPTKIYVGAV